VVGLLLTLPGAWGLLPEATTFVLYPALLCPPVAVAVAVLRYRLWDLDRLISRTLAWVLVTGLLILPYLLILPAVTRLAGDAGSLAVAAATLAAAAAFQPLRRRVQDLVDRRFNRRRYDAARSVEGFVARLREQVDLEVLSAAAGGGRADGTAGSGVAVATPAGHPAAAAVAQSLQVNTTVTCQPNTQGPGNIRVGEMVVEDAPAVTPSGPRRTQTVPSRPHRRGVPWICNAAPAGPCPPAWRVGRSPATRPRAVTPGDPPDDPSARRDQPHGRIGDRQGP
jgi:hypothetical protein